MRGWPWRERTHSTGPRANEPARPVRGRHQLIVYRAFFEPGVHGWPEHACIGCSLRADWSQSCPPQRKGHHGIRLRAPQDIARLKAQMGWEHIPVRSRTALTPTSAWMNGTATTRSSATAAHYRTYMINSRGDEAMGTV